MSPRRPVRSYKVTLGLATILLSSWLLAVSNGWNGGRGTRRSGCRSRRYDTGVPAASATGLDRPRPTEGMWSHQNVRITKPVTAMERDDRDLVNAGCLVNNGTILLLHLN